jgi:meso-butanediol dehydrogenase / (S,S)-butanediol dehydrogenase / diacetyl reductase
MAKSSPPPPARECPPVPDPARAAIVTGGGTGIGAAIVRRLTADGWNVMTCGRREAPLRSVAAATGARFVVCDCATAGGVHELVESTLASFDRLDGLVLNAGVVRPGTVTELTPEDWDETLRINLTGPFLLARAALDALRATAGAIVGVGSVAGMRAGPAYAAYGASKAGLHMLMQAIAVDHGPDGVRANCIAPGWVRTEMADAEMAELGAELGTTADKAYTHVTAAVPARRPATADEVAASAAWLLSPDATYITGAILTVDGGTAGADVGTVAFARDAPRGSTSGHERCAG